jgi:heme exporter protein C
MSQEAMNEKPGIFWTVLKILLFLWLGAVITGAFLYAPLAKGLGEYTRVLYFHVPTAWVTVVAFFLGALFSVLYLRKRDIRYDYYAESASQLGIVFCILATTTGSVWAKVSWGSFWNWDPRETSIFILLLIYAAYFALRSAIEQPDRRAALSSVYSLLAFVTVPFFVFIVPRVYQSLHPDPLINTEGKINMDSRMLTVFLSSLFGFTVLFFWMLKLKLDLVHMHLRLKRWRNK